MPATGKERGASTPIPGPGEPRHETWARQTRGARRRPVWVTGSYDPDLNLTYWGIGNPGPDWNGDDRAGDNLYTDSVVALDADTGKLKWHFQFTPHDEFDYDSTQVPVLADIEWQGRPRKVMLWANRNGFWYVLDRATGEFLSGKPFTKVTWTERARREGPAARTSVKPDGRRHASSIRTGRRHELVLAVVQPAHRAVLRSDAGWTRPRRSPSGRPSSSKGARSSARSRPRPTLGINGTQVNRRLPEEGHGAVLALDPKTGEKKWEFTMTDVTDAGVLTTASDLLFSGGREGFFYRARREDRRAAVEGGGRRHRPGGADVLRDRRP